MIGHVQIRARMIHQPAFDLLPMRRISDDPDRPILRRSPSDIPPHAGFASALGLARESDLQHFQRAFTHHGLGLELSGAQHI